MELKKITAMRDEELKVLVDEKEKFDQQANMNQGFDETNTQKLQALAAEYPEERLKSGKGPELAGKYENLI